MSIFQERKTNSSIFEINNDDVATWDAPFDPYRSTNISDQEYLKKLSPQRVTLESCVHKYDITPVRCPCGSTLNGPTYPCQRCSGVACVSCRVSSSSTSKSYPPINSQLLPEVVKVRDDGIFVPHIRSKEDRLKFRKYVASTLQKFGSRVSHVKAEYGIVEDTVGESERVQEFPTKQLTETIEIERDESLMPLQVNNGGTSNSVDTKDVLKAPKNGIPRTERLRKKFDASERFSQSKVTVRQAVRQRKD